MIRVLLAFLGLAFLQGCVRAPTAEASPPPARLEERTESLHFLYSYPAEAAAIPALAERLRKEGVESLSEARESAAYRARPRSGPDKVEQVWETSVDTPELIALISTAETYQDSSAHGYYAFRTTLWDKSGDRALSLAELFLEPRGVEELMSALCERLRLARAERSRGSANGGPAPMECPRPDESAVVPVAGPSGRIESFRMMLTGDQTPEGYAGGGYEIEAPVTPDLAALVRPALRGSF